MPDFWQFPNASMGLGPINAIYQARFMRYLEDRSVLPASDGNTSIRRSSLGTASADIIGFSRAETLSARVCPSPCCLRFLVPSSTATARA